MTDGSGRPEPTDDRYRDIFMNSPTPFWVEDFSAVAALLGRLRSEGVTDVRAYFRDRPDELAAAAASVRILEVNDAVRGFLEGDSDEIIDNGISRNLNEESFSAFGEELALIAEGKRRFDLDVTSLTCGGRNKRIALRWVAAPGHEDTLDLVYVSGVDVTDRWNSERLVQRSLEEKTALVDEIHFRVKHNLSVICSLLGLQEERAPSAETAASLRTARDRVFALAMVHERMCVTSGAAGVPMLEYLEAILAEAADRRGVAVSVATEVEGDDVTLDLASAAPCGIVANELVTNAVVHAFAGRRTGSVRAAFRKTGDGYQLTVEDDGVGAGRDVLDRPGLGLGIVKLLAGQLGGSVHLAGSERGTRVTLSFPARRHV